MFHNSSSQVSISDVCQSHASQVDPPDVQGRYEILKVHAKGKNLAPGVDLLAVARQTPGMSGWCRDDPGRNGYHDDPIQPGLRV